VVGYPRHHPHRTRTPTEPLAGPLRPPTHPTRLLRPPASRESTAGLLRPLAPRKPPTAPIPPSTVTPHCSKPQERPPIGVGRPKCPKNNDKIYQMKQLINNK
jgi:hypothetical protein